MRKLLIVSAILVLGASTAFAVPYASYIRVSDTTVAPGSGMDISYYLNEDADSVTIELVPSGGGAAVATTTLTSPATGTAAGPQTINWDGSADFAGGAVVPDGSYRVEITVDNSVAAGWAEFASNRSVGAFGEPTILETLFEGFSGKDILIQTDPDNDLFGLILPASSFGTPEHMGHIPLFTDLNTLGGGDGLADILLQNPGLFQNNQGVWGSFVDPTDSNLIWVVGQNSGEVNFMNAVVNSPAIPAFLTDADPLDSYAGAFPRSIAIYENGATRYGLTTAGEGALNAVEITGANETAGAFENLLSLTVTTRYSKDVEVDAAGNVYWATRRESSGAETGGRLYRWDSATVAAAISDAATNPLTDANASWVVDVPAASESVNGVTIGPAGEVYLQVASDGIYEVGNVSTATLTTTLGAGQLIVDFSTIGAGYVPSGFGANVAADAAGNLYTVDTSNEQIRAFSPGGTTSLTFPAPLSQTVIVSTVTATTDWNLYH